MSRRNRDYRAEYQKRIASGLAKGLSKSQARGHPRAGEAPRSPPTRIDRNDPLEKALALMKQGTSQREAAKRIGVPVERLRRFVKENTTAVHSGKSWSILDSRTQGFHIVSKGRLITVTLPNHEGHRVGQYWNAVNRFLATNDRRHIDPFIDQAVTDVDSVSHSLEVRPNVLRRMDSIGEIEFHEIYADVAK